MTFFGDIALPIVLFLIMIGIGLSTRLLDFQSLIKFPKAAILGVVSQLIILPLLALFIGFLFDYSNELILGLLLLSLCPSGTGSNIITKMVGGNLALSVSLTTISSVKSLVTIPFFLGLFLERVNGEQAYITLPYLDLILKVFFLTIVPTVIGLFIGEKFPKIVIATKGLLKWLLPALLFGVFTAIMFFDEKKNSDVDIFEMIVPAVVINISSMLVTYGFVKLFKVDLKQALAVSVEGGLKNSAIGLLIATSFLKVPEAQLLILAYSFISFYLTLGISIVLKRVGN